MLPPNTVEITAEELKQLPTIMPYYFLAQSELGTLYWKTNIVGCFLEGEKFRIEAFIYRHYFGEVVDLVKYETFVRQVVWRVEFLNNEFELHKYSWECRVYDYSQDENYALISGTEAECKQFIADHFTAIVNKDLPHHNIRFIFS